MSPVFATVPGTDTKEQDRSQTVSTPTTTLRTTTMRAASTSSVLPTTSTLFHQSIHLRGKNISVDIPKLQSQYGGIDADLLNIGIATGAPLDLEAESNRLVAYRTRNQSNRAPSTTQRPPPVFQHPVVGRTKTTLPPKTPFERLAVDYKERLTGAGDMDKILKTLYSNAYIALVDAKEASSVRIPLSMRRAQAGLG